MRAAGTGEGVREAKLLTMDPWACHRGFLMVGSARALICQVCSYIGILRPKESKSKFGKEMQSFLEIGDSF